VRLFDVLSRGIVVVPATARSTGPWLGATRTPSLQRIANRPIVCHVLDALRAAGAGEIALVAPSDVTEELTACVADEGPADVEIHHLTHPPGQSAGGLRAAAKLLGDDAPCILHRGDGLLGQPLPAPEQTLREDSSDALLLVQHDGSDGGRLKLVPPPSLALTGNGGYPAPAGVAGVCLLAPGVLAHMVAAESEPAPDFAALATEPAADFAPLAMRFARDGGRVHMRVVHRWRHFAGNAHDLLDMNRVMLDALDPDLTVSSYDGNRFEGAVVIHPTACVSSSVIIGPVVIGAESLITDSYVGPHTSIGERVRIEGAELERSIVLAGASVLHVGGRVVASVVGRNARIFRDFSVPRALRLQVGDGDEVALC
jgi:glucose-1-phosphate thymidylyltransferase